jgi:hypothetical protein
MLRHLTLGYTATCSKIVLDHGAASLKCTVPSLAAYHPILTRLNHGSATQHRQHLNHDFQAPSPIPVVTCQVDTTRVNTIKSISPTSLFEKR